MGNDISEALRNEISRRANHRCEYCLIHEDDTGFRLQVDHIISRKHGGMSVVDNLAYACALCNRNKETDVASVGSRGGEIVRLFHPRRDRWADHLGLDANLIRGISKIGSVTAELLRFNTPERLAERGVLQALSRYPVGA